MKTGKEPAACCGTVSDRVTHPIEGFPYTPKTQPRSFAPPPGGASH
jgi:hypothetical protein